MLAFPQDEQDTKEIPIEDSNKTDSDVSFDLGIHVPRAAGENGDQKPENKIINSVKQTSNQSTTKTKRGRLGPKVWSILEWITTSAAIFLVLFLIMNYQAYSELFFSKMDQLKSDIRSNPAIEEQYSKIRRSAAETNGEVATEETQKPLPIVKSSQKEKKQIPPLELEVTPPDTRVNIPRISKNVPIVRVSTEKLIQRDWEALENEIQDALRSGVVHFPGTALPGQDGNVVITGHSSYFPWDPGRFKDVFALLHQVSIGDQIEVYHNQQKYNYVVYDKKVVKPDQVEVLTQKGDDRLTLITCTPVGTNINRLIILARQV